MIKLFHPTSVLKGELSLPSSKSISNRLLLLRKLYAPHLNIQNLSEANDSLIMNRVLTSSESHHNVEDAGTAMRFLTAYLATLPTSSSIFGTERMHQRPIKELVDSLRLLGAEINYLEEEGFPPLSIKGGDLKASQIDLRSAESSQFVSALLMILPSLSVAPKVVVNPKMNSWSFVQLTLDVMAQMGLQYKVERDEIQFIERQKPPRELVVEADYSSLYYYLLLASVAKEADLFIRGVKQDSIQSESTYLRLFEESGLALKFTEKGLSIRTHKSIKKMPSSINLKDHPDLAPTLATLYAMKKQQLTCKGLESLRIKESNRDVAIGEHLNQVNCSWERVGDFWKMDATHFKLGQERHFQSFDDHRMLMSASAYSLLGPIELDNHHAVNKSFPNYWQELKSIGFVIEE